VLDHSIYDVDYDKPSANETIDFLITLHQQNIILYMRIFPIF